MICKLNDFRHGYAIRGTDAGDDEVFQEILKSYEKVHCIICNRNTARHFRTPLLGGSIITINNTLLDGVFYINHVF